MSKISDEIREWCDLVDVNDHIDVDALIRLRKLGNRIDYEMVELPKDKGGEPIHVGYTVYNFESGKKLYVNELRLGKEWKILTNYGDIDNPTDFTKNKPDSLERIADEIENTNLANPQLREWADRIRKIAKKEASDEL